MASTTYLVSGVRARKLARALPTSLLAIALLDGAGAGAQALADATPLPSDTVTIEAQRLQQQARRSGIAEMSSAPLAQTPLAIDAIHSDALIEAGANSLSSAIRGETSVGDDYNTFGYVEALQIRGFALDELLNYRRDGMTVSNHVPIALENKESIEILKGVSGIVAGSSAPGGLVNYVLKRPTDAPLAVLRGQVSERGSLLAHGDFGGRFGDGLRFGYRINIAAEQRRPEIDNAWAKRALASGFFDWRAGADTLVEAEFEHHRAREISVPGYGLLDTYGAGYGQVLPSPIDPRINLNAQPWTQPFESVESAGSLRLSQRLGPIWDLSLRAGTQRSVTNDRVAFPDGCSSAAVYVYPGLCGNYAVDIYQFVSDGERRNSFDTDTYLHGRVGGAVDHELRAGVRTTRYSERYPALQAYNFVGTIDVFAPAALPASPVPATPNAPNDRHLSEIYVYDTMHFLRRWSAWLGARSTRIDQASALTDGSQAVALSQRIFTPWAALGYEPWQGSFAYISSGSGVEVASVPNRPDLYVNPGQVLPAMRSRQVELGFKQDIGDRSKLSLALFRIEKPFADGVPQPGVPAWQVVGARVQRHRGLEIEQTWAPPGSLYLDAAATLLQAETVQATNPDYVGKAVPNVPHLSAKLQQGWEVPQVGGLTWNNLLVFSGHRPVLRDASVDLPSSWQWDTALRYRVSRAGSVWTWRAGIDNVTDRRYWREAPTAPWGATYLFPAAARAARVGVEVAL